MSTLRPRAVRGRAPSVRDRLLSRLRLPPSARGSAPRVDRSFTIDGIVAERWWIPGPRGPIPALFLLPAGHDGGPRGPQPPAKR